jgi:GxxExxY protein
MSPSDPSKALERVLACTQAAAAGVGPEGELEQYETALERSMRGQQLQFARQYPIGVPFYGPRHRGFYADFIVEGVILLELVRVKALGATEADLALNYLRESGADLCLLINFGRAPVEVRRILPSGESRAEIP